MTLLWCDGFDWLDVSGVVADDPLEQKYKRHTENAAGIADAVQSTDVTQFAIGRAIQLNNGEWIYSKRFPSLTQTLVVGWRQKWDEAPSPGDRVVMYFRDYISDSNRGFQAKLTFERDGNSAFGAFKLWRGDEDALLAESDPDFEWSAYHYYELKMTLSTSSTGSYEFRANGNVVFSGSSVRTSDDKNGADWVQMFGAEETFLDDWYVLDDAGTENNDFLGDQIIRTVFPDADGANSQWDRSPTGVSGNDYENVRKGGTGILQEDVEQLVSTYLASDSANEKVTLSHDTLDVEGGDIHAVVQEGYLRNESATQRDFRFLFRESGGSEYAGSDITTETTGYLGYQRFMEQNPDTSADWVENDINNGEFGVESRA